eukprot:TRINITY_DN10013_c0_g1_i2.p1 TRINITY_DN10013_c0_g1~~TRINITY_DN10013_c0_g1_i2.p1  ORF type:complete len:909 (+),score=248.09 TRINITY_DN10013_c0_g1_i2:3-2729(+)
MEDYDDDDPQEYTQNESQELIDSKIPEERVSLLDHPDHIPPRFVEASLWSSFTSSFWIRSLRFTLRDTRKSKTNCCLGFLSCVVVVFVVTLISTAIDKSPVIFLTMAELEEAEVDFRIEVASYSNNTLLNHTLVNDILTDATHRLHSPRYDKSVVIFSAKQCNASYDPFDPQWKYVLSGNNCTFSKDNCFPIVCPDAVANEGDLLVADSDREDAMDLGRNWIDEKLGIPKLGEIFVMDTVAKDLHLDIGDVMYIRLNGSQFFEGLWQQIVVSKRKQFQLENSTDEISVDFIYFPVTVSKIFVGNLGKFSVYTTAGLYMEYSTFLPHVSRHFNPNMSRDSQLEFNNTSLYQYASQIVWNLPDPRVEVYIDSSYDSISEKLIGFSSDILYRIGFIDLRPELPILQSMAQTAPIGVILGLLLNVIVSILCILSIMMIYSLMSINIQRKSFDIGILRSLGISLPRLIYTLLIQSSLYVIPAWIFGLVAAQGALMGGAAFLKHVTHVPLGNTLGIEPVLLATVIVIVVPLGSTFLPVRDVLGISVMDALDTRRSKTKAVAITIERSSSTRIPGHIIFLGAGGGIFGFSIFYIFPLSLLNQNFDLLGSILIFILIGFMLGLLMLASNFQLGLERLIAFLFLFWESQTIRNLLRKNMVAHRSRNRVTSLSFSLAVSFVIFLFVMYDLQTKNFLYQQQRNAGSFLRVNIRSIAGKSVGIPIATELEQLCDKLENIQGYAWMTHPANTLTNDDVIELMTRGKLISQEVELYGISKNFFEVAFQEFYIPSTSNSNLMEDLYNNPHGVLLGSYYESLYAVDQSRDEGDSALLLYGPFFNQTKAYERVIPVGFLDSAPVFLMSEYPKEDQAVLVSLPHYAALGNLTQDEIPFGSMLLKLKDEVSDIFRVRTYMLKLTSSC